MSPAASLPLSLQTLCKCGLTWPDLRNLPASLWVQQRWVPRKTQHNLEALTLFCQICPFIPETRRSPRLGDLHQPGRSLLTVLFATPAGHLCFWSLGVSQESPRHAGFFSSKRCCQKMLRKYHCQAWTLAPGSFICVT